MKPAIGVDDVMMFRKGETDMMDPATWGPTVWGAAHAIAYAFPEHPTDEERSMYLAYFSSLGNVLPCVQCRDNWKHALEASPLTDAVVENKNSLCRWLFEMHNVVNKSLGKESYSWIAFIHRYPNVASEEDMQLMSERRLNRKGRQMDGRRTSSQLPVVRDKSLGTVNSNLPVEWQKSMEMIGKYLVGPSNGATAPRNNTTHRPGNTVVVRGGNDRVQNGGGKPRGCGCNNKRSM